MTHSANIARVLLLGIAGCGRSTGSGLEANTVQERTAHSPALAPTPPNTETQDAGVREAKGHAPDQPAPLRAEREIVALQVDGFGDAVASLPLGTTAPKPVLLALHGNFDRPEWQCEVWRTIVHDGGFVLCPRGIPRRDTPKVWDRWEYGNVKRTTAEIDAALAALRARFGAYVAEGPVVFTGFSLGAILGVHIVQSKPERFPRVVLIEGGQGAWSLPRAKRFKERGGERVLFACGQTPCVQTSRAIAKLLEKNSVFARVVFGGNVGHTYDGVVANAISESWDWLVEGDARWAAARQEPD